MCTYVLRRVNFSAATDSYEWTKKSALSCRKKVTCLSNLQFFSPPNQKHKGNMVMNGFNTEFVAKNISQATYQDISQVKTREHLGLMGLWVVPLVKFCVMIPVFLCCLISCFLVLFWNCVLLCHILLFRSSLCVFFPPSSIFPFLPSPLLFPLNSNFSSSPH